MYPELISISIPDFLQSVLPETLTIYSYGAFILMGVLLSYGFLWKFGKKEFGLSSENTQNLLLGLIVMAVVGGKFFLIFESPSTYLQHPSMLLSNSGFVFYGSLIFGLGFLGFYINKNHLPMWQFLDLMAFVILIVHSFGRLGCFMAGCCHGIPTNSWIGIAFHHPLSQAEPLHTPLIPTQLISALFLWGLFFVLLMVKKRRQFYGQVFLSYLIIYSLGRSVIEEFRGDEARGFVADGWYSNSQFISTIIILISITMYFILRSRNKKDK